MVWRLGLICLAAISTSCAGTGNAQVPSVPVKIWAGDSSVGGISRAQDNQHMSCMQPMIDDYACMTYTDLKLLYAVLQQCKDWGPTKMESSDEVIRKNPDVAKKIQNMGDQ